MQLQMYQHKNKISITAVVCYWERNSTVNKQDSLPLYRKFNQINKNANCNQKAVTGNHGRNVLIVGMKLKLEFLRFEVDLEIGCVTSKLPQNELVIYA